MNHCPIHQRDYEVACPECMGEAAAECSTIIDMGGLKLGPAVFERIDVNGVTVFDAENIGRPIRPVMIGDSRIRNAHRLRELLFDHSAKGHMLVPLVLPEESAPKIVIPSMPYEKLLDVKHVSPGIDCEAYSKLILATMDKASHWLHKFWREATILYDRRRGLTHSDLWIKYPEFTKAQIRKIIRGIPRGTRIEPLKPYIVIDEEAI